MNVLIIQHTALDSPGIITDFLTRHDAAVETIRLDKGHAIPESSGADVMMSFGGPQSLHVDNLPPWVEQQRRLMRHVLDRGGKVFGICLGAQLLASALGAKTGPNRQPEVGWHEITRVAPASMGIELPKRLTTLHWHQNTFELPPGAKHWFRSRACEHQGFAIGDQAVGFQFHPETTTKTIRYYTEVSKLCQLPGEYVQPPETILTDAQNYLAEQQAWLRKFLTNWLGY